MSSRITGTRAWLLSLPPLPIETEPPVSTGCGATLAVPAHAGHHGCIRAALSCALEQRATVAPTCHLASPAASRSRRSPPSLGTATAPVPAAAVAFRFLPTARPDPRRATPPTHKHGHTPRHRRPPSPLPPPPPSLSPPLPPTCFTADSKREAAKARRQNPE